LFQANTSYLGISSKLYTPPSNPNTAGQKGVRSIFAHVGHIAHKIYKGVLEPYTFPVPREITKYNRMIQINKDMFSQLIWEPSQLKIFAGDLQSARITDARYSAIDDTVTVSWDAALGAPDDLAVVVVYYEHKGNVLYMTGLKREDASVIVNTAQMGFALDVHALHVYLVFTQLPAPQNSNLGMVSNTTYSVVG